MNSDESSSAFERIVLLLLFLLFFEYPATIVAIYDPIGSSRQTSKPPVIRWPMGEVEEAADLPILYEVFLQVSYLLNSLPILYVVSCSGCAMHVQPTIIFWFLLFSKLIKNLNQFIIGFYPPLIGIDIFTGPYIFFKNKSSNQKNIIIILVINIIKQYRIWKIKIEKNTLKCIQCI